MHQQPDQPRRYVVPRWPGGEFNLLAEKGKFELGPFTADSWGVGEDGSLECWPESGAHPVRLRVRMQVGDVIYANDGDMGPMTFRIVPLDARGERTRWQGSDPYGVDGKLSALLGFLDRGPLTHTVAGLELALEGTGGAYVAAIIERFDIAPAVLEAALVVRERFGRISDVIHASAIALCLPDILAPDEVLVKPSLAAGNSPSTPFDIETDQRVAEFKLAEWEGSDAMRKRQLAKDLVHLAAEGSGRRAELYVLGERPIRFLADSRSSMGWALDRFPKSLALLESRFGSEWRSAPISDFRAGPAAHVEVIDLTDTLGSLLASR